MRAHRALDEEDDREDGPLLPGRPVKTEALRSHLLFEFDLSIGSEADTVRAADLICIGGLLLGVAVGNNIDTWGLFVGRGRLG